MLCLLGFMIGLCIFDYKLVMNLFKQFTDWIKFHPWLSIGYSIGILALSVVLTLPVSYSIIMLGYTYAQVFDSKLYGFLFSVPIIYTGCLTGAFFAFLISRYLFQDFIKDQIKSNSWLSSNFNLIDDIITTEGCKVVGLLRLTFAPFGITSYIMGVSSISLKDYMLGNASYIINSCTQCFIGVSLYTIKLNKEK